MHLWQAKVDIHPLTFKGSEGQCREWVRDVAGSDDLAARQVFVMVDGKPVLIGVVTGWKTENLSANWHLS